MKASIAALVGTRFAIIGGGQNGEVDGAVLHDCRDQKRKALETSEVTLQALCEGLKKFEIKHPNFGGPSTSQSFLWKILQINELTPHFSSCSVRLHLFGKNQITTSLDRPGARVEKES